MPALESSGGEEVFCPLEALEREEVFFLSTRGAIEEEEVGWET